MMLHTDVFNSNNKNKMSKADYVKNTRLDGVPQIVLEVRKMGEVLYRKPCLIRMLYSRRFSTMLLLRLSSTSRMKRYRKARLLR